MTTDANIEPFKNVSDKSVNNEAVIRINNLSISFENQEVLHNVSVTLNNGENLVVLGRSGQGKSVLIRCIIGLLNADSGSIYVFGKDVTTIKRRELEELRLKIGFLFQNGALYDSMTVRQNLEFPLRRIKKSLSEHEIENKIIEVLKQVHLTEAINKMPSQLSGGMRKRISLARSIIVSPMIMLYDEPTAGLDPVTSNEINSLINDVRVKYKTSSMIITHDIECARATGDRVVMLHDGEVYKEGNMEEFERSDDLLVRSFFK